MLKYDPAKMVERAKGCLANKKEIIEVADKLSQEGFSNTFFIGVGRHYHLCLVHSGNAETSDHPGVSCRACR